MMQQECAERDAFCMAITGGKIIYKQHKKMARERRNTPKLKQKEIVETYEKIMERMARTNA